MVNRIAGAMLLAFATVAPAQVTQERVDLAMVQRIRDDVDTYDHLVIDDLKQAAVTVAATVYNLAMRDEMMPRKPRPATPSSN